MQRGADCASLLGPFKLLCEVGEGLGQPGED